MTECTYLMETKYQWDVFNSRCPTRQVLDRIADKWTVLVVRRLANGTLRFAQLRRAVDGISQKVLTNILRGLERDGLVHRRLYASVPPRVEYSLTQLGLSLVDLVSGVCSWAETHMEQVEQARIAYDATNLSARRNDPPSGVLASPSGRWPEEACAARTNRPRRYTNVLSLGKSHSYQPISPSSPSALIRDVELRRTTALVLRARNGREDLCLSHGRALDGRRIANNVVSP